MASSFSSMAASPSRAARVGSGLAEVTFTVACPELEHEPAGGFGRHVVLLGDDTALGAWETKNCVSLHRSAFDVKLWTTTVVLPMHRVAHYKFAIMRRDFVCAWETIPNNRAFVPRDAVCEAPAAELGKLPEDHPKRKGGTSVWMDRHFITPQQGSEIRVMIGADRMRPGLVINDSRPLALRMRVVSDRGCDTVSSTDGHVKAQYHHWWTSDKDARRMHDLCSYGYTPYTEGEVCVFSTHADRTAMESRAAHSSCVIDVVARDAHDSGCGKLIGQATVSLDTFCKKEPRTGHARVSRGSFTLPIFRVPEVDIIAGESTVGVTTDIRVPTGQLFCDFLVVDPFVHPANTLEHVWRKYWTRRDTLDIGHRGAGRSYSHVPGQRLASLRENTVLSFSSAGLAGAEYVELDVMLTKDRIPVIYHDFLIAVNAAMELGDTDLVALQMDQLTLKQLKQLQTDAAHGDAAAEDSDDASGVDSASDAGSTATWPGAPGSGGGSGGDSPKRSKSMRQQLASLVRKHARSIHSIAVDRGISSARAVSNDQSRLKVLMRAIPTLKEVLHGCPPWLGLNIEIKYPHEPDIEYLGYMHSYELNEYLDEILKVVFEEAGQRRIMFSCFHPDVCTALVLKQARYPVCFLTCGGIPAYYSDRRCNSVDASFAFALRDHLQGVVMNSEALFTTTDWDSGAEVSDHDHADGKVIVERFRASNLLLLTWGNPNSHSMYVDAQRTWGVDGVIADNIGDIVKLRGKDRSTFEDDGYRRRKGGRGARAAAGAGSSGSSDADASRGSRSKSGNRGKGGAAAADQDAKSASTVGVALLVLAGAALAAVVARSRR